MWWMIEFYLWHKSLYNREKRQYKQLGNNCWFLAQVPLALFLYFHDPSFLHCFILGKIDVLSRWSEIYHKSTLLHKLPCSLSSLLPSYLGFWAVPYLDITLSLEMPHLFIILSLQGTDSFSLFKFDLLTFPLPCNLEIIWGVLSMKDTRCQIIILCYSLWCQWLVRKLYLTYHYFCWSFAC